MSFSSEKESRKSISFYFFGRRGRRQRKRLGIACETNGARLLNYLSFFFSKRNIKYVFPTSLRLVRCNGIERVKNIIKQKSLNNCRPADAVTYAIIINKNKMYDDCQTTINRSYNDRVGRVNIYVALNQHNLRSFL